MSAVTLCTVKVNYSTIATKVKRFSPETMEYIVHDIKNLFSSQQRTMIYPFAPFRIFLYQYHKPFLFARSFFHPNATFLNQNRFLSPPLFRHVSSSILPIPENLAVYILLQLIFMHSAAFRPSLLMLSNLNALLSFDRLLSQPFRCFSHSFWFIAKTAIIRQFLLFLPSNIFP